MPTQKSEPIKQVVSMKYMGLRESEQDFNDRILESPGDSNSRHQQNGALSKKIN